MGGAKNGQCPLYRLTSVAAQRNDIGIKNGNNSELAALHQEDGGSIKEATLIRRDNRIIPLLFCLCMLVCIRVDVFVCTFVSFLTSLTVCANACIFCNDH